MVVVVVGSLGIAAAAMRNCIRRAELVHMIFYVSAIPAFLIPLISFKFP